MRKYQWRTLLRMPYGYGNQSNRLAYMFAQTTINVETKFIVKNTELYVVRFVVSIYEHIKSFSEKIYFFGNMGKNP